MARKEFIIHPTRADLPYSAAVRSGDFIFVSGTLGHVDAAGNPINGIAAQTIQCLENLNRTLETAGVSLGDVVKTTVFLSNFDDFAAMNEAYVKYFPESRPARSTAIAALVRREALVEIECVVYKP
ncbi:MAG: RidA family protein [Dehalococcoidales bacterium]|nr:RidA family protein [Dehalococcoidales bacterium]